MNDTEQEILTLWQIQNGNILASYPVPPSSRFLGPPCSIRAELDGQPNLTTYCALKRETARIELFRSVDEDTARPTNTTVSALRDQDSAVTQLDVLPGHPEDRVLVVQQNGDLTLLSADLQSTILESKLYSDNCRVPKILAVRTLTQAEAKRTVLRRRPDVVSAIASDAYLLAVAYTALESDGSTRRLWYGLWAVDLSGNSAVSTNGILRPILEHELRLDGASSRKEKACTFGLRASSLFVRTGDAFFSYALTGLLPSPSATFRTGLSGNYEVMAISPATAICSYHDVLQLYDLKYQSIQAQIGSKPMNLKRKRERDQPTNEASGYLEFVAYYPHSSRVIGRRRHQLLAIDLASTSDKHALVNGSTLLQNIGRGISGQKQLDSYAKNLKRQSKTGQEALVLRAHSRAEWESTRERLDQLAQNGDHHEFENTFVDSLFNDSPPTEAQGPRNTLSSDAAIVPDFKIHYLLSKLFFGKDHEVNGIAENGTAGQHMTVQILSNKLMLWVCRIGLLSARNLNAMCAHMKSSSRGIFTGQNLAAALLTADPSCELLTGCLDHGFSPYMDEVVAVIQLLLQQALDNPTPARNGSDSGNLSPAQGPDTQLQILTDSSTENASVPTSVQGALIAALNRLGTAASSVISVELKKALSQTEILALVQFLRQQLFLAGHTRSFSTLPVTENLSTNVRFEVAVKILSSCIDAIGPLGGSGTIANEDFIGNVVSELAAEITNAKQGLEDAADLQGILRETLRYGESIQRQQASGGRLPGHVTSDGGKDRSAVIMTVYSDSAEAHERLQPGSALPLGSKLENVVDAVKIRKGGGQSKQRSVRQMKMLERRNKGQYSFERLVL
jgi:hypothetical protein